MGTDRAVEADTSFGVLFVCTGNICRSPVAERLTRAYLDAALRSDAALVRLGSAGTRAVVGSGVHPESSVVLSNLGGDPGGFVARQLTDRTAAAADLTLTLTRAHRRAVLSRTPTGLSRTFTLLEAADLATFVPIDDDLPGATFEDRCRSFVRAMARARARRATDAHDDIADPIGQAASFHQAVGEEIAEAVVRLFGRVAALSAVSNMPTLTGAAPTNLLLSRR